MQESIFFRRLRIKGMVIYIFNNSFNDADQKARWVTKIVILQIKLIRYVPCIAKSEIHTLMHDRKNPDLIFSEGI